MTRNVDRIIELLDNSLQTPSTSLNGYYQNGYGPDAAPGACWRCKVLTTPEGTICDRCRAFLLEDSDDDPLAPKRKLSEQAAQVLNSEVAQYFGCDDDDTALLVQYIWGMTCMDDTQRSSSSGS